MGRRRSSFGVMRRRPRIFGWSRDLRHGVCYVNRVDPSGPVNGILQVGDRIVDFEGHHGPLWFVNRLVLLTPAGGLLHLTVQRDGRQIELALPVRGSHGLSIGPFRYWPGRAWSVSPFRC